MVIWISLNGARKCVCLETQEQDSWHSFTTNTSGSSLNWWWFLLLIHDRWHYTISDPSWSVAATSRLGQVESMGSMISFRCCSVLFAIPTLSFGRQLARFFDLLCHVLMLYRRHLCFFFPQYPPTIFQRMTGFVRVGIRWINLTIPVGLMSHD